MLPRESPLNPLGDHVLFKKKKVLDNSYILSGP